MHRAIDVYDRKRFKFEEHGHDKYLEQGRRTGKKGELLFIINLRMPCKTDSVLCVCLKDGFSGVCGVRVGCVEVGVGVLLSF